MSIKIPIGNIQDPAALAAIVAINDQFQIWDQQKGVVDDKSILVKDLRKIGVVAVDEKGRLSNPLAPTAAAFAEQDVTEFTADRISQIAKISAAGGKAVGTYSTGITIPDNSRVVRAWYNVGLTFASATSAATIALGVNTDDPAGILAAIAINDASSPWSGNIHSTICNGSQANYTVQTTAARTIDWVVGVEALTTGVLGIYVEYIIVE